MTRRASARSDDAFVIDDFEPAAVATERAGGLDAKVAAARSELADCRMCPRDCVVDRMAGHEGVCKTGRDAIVSSAFAHFGEEDCLRGRNGSGTIFFSMCNLRCVFCQNWDISQKRSGTEYSPDEIADLALGLQDSGCHNINFVTPEHVAAQVAEAVVIAVRRGLRLPIVYNTSAYDGLESLALMDGLVDIYMPDFKFWDPATARRLARARDYPAVARAAISEMHRQVGPLRFGRDGLAKRGVLVRHLVMPGQADQGAQIMDWIGRELSVDTFVNLMAQYRPDHKVGTPDAGGILRYAEIGRPATRREIDTAFEAARSAGLWRFDARRPFSLR